jgi:hypothetical protein
MRTVTPIRPTDGTLSQDITPAYGGYTGPPIGLSWRNGVGVARADDPRCPVPWVLVPTSLLTRLAAASDDPGLAGEVAALVREAPTSGYGPNGLCSLCADHAAAGTDICADCIARGNPA